MLTVVKSAVWAVLDNLPRLRRPARIEPDAKAPSCPPGGLCELPVELLAMILEELDWRDVLRVRKVLQGVSKTRSVWLNLCRPHLSPTPTAPQTLHLDRPIKLYSSHDLELLFLQLTSADIGWKTDANAPARKREVETTYPVKCMHLVEGGRWLLVASETGRIAYFDLDAPTPTESILVPDQFDPFLRDEFDPGAEVQVVMAIDRDYDSEFLAFNLAISFTLRNSPPPDPKAHSVQIWRVELALDELQRGVGLKAEPLASFPLEHYIDVIYCQSIRGAHIALSLLGPRHTDRQLTFIIDWKQADGDQTDYPRRLIHPPYGKMPTAMYLLPDNKLFSAGNQVMMINDYLNIPETTSLPPLRFTDATVLPLWNVLDERLHPRSGSISRPFFCSHSIRFSIRGGDTIHGVIIEYPYNEDPVEPLAQVVKLMEKADKHPMHECYGYSKGTIVKPYGTYLFSYPWPDAQDDLPPLLLHTEASIQHCQFGPLLDEQGGRVAVSADIASRSKDSRDKVHIWDFALIYK
ncbi:hypothetical protein M413DRAFT_285578 [Hebeloma cylindrosporum]|uniref:F-box domain-containing protein n=1 Tax=Hebeloma cylindrosporum TaxID=76867 RepID=A0A0C3BIV0_HEBCY|nr:hypothetical protein M413DRAFT_285578 [Hebeloma cylindrosporum h7]